MNSMNNHLQTKSGKPIINRKTGTRIYTQSVEYRIKLIKKQLGINIGKLTSDERWANIVSHTKRLCVN